MTRAEGQVAIVTGAASGIGRALSLALARSGVAVAAVDVNVEGIHTLEREVADSGGRAYGFVCDVSRPDALAEVTTAMLQRAGRIDFLFNVAGLEINGDVLAVDSAKWQAGFAVDLGGVMCSTQTVYPVLLKQGFGHIVNIASLAGLVPLPGLAYYTAAKHGVVGFSLALRAEARARGVKVSVACPALVDTGLRANTTAYLGRASAHSPRLRWPRPISAERCAQAILRGVAGNQDVIMIPWTLNWVWWLYRLSPRLFTALISRLYHQGPVWADE